MSVNVIIRNGKPVADSSTNPPLPPKSTLRKMESEK
jgi:hypothetical protein